MKRVLLFLTIMLLSFSLQGQIIRANPFHKAVVAASGDTSFIRTDGYTEGWYIADAGNITLDGSVITVWNDETDNNNDLENATGTDRPTWDSGNGEIDFDGTDDMISDATFSYSQPVLVYMVVAFRGQTNDDFIVGIATYGSGKVVQADTDELNMSGGGETLTTTNAQLATNTYYILRFLWNNNTSNGSKAQVNAATAHTGTLGTATASFLKVGGTTEGDGSYANLSIKEIIVRSTADSEASQTIIVNYLNTKYSVY